jgi:hypothetical protein
MNFPSALLSGFIATIVLASTMSASEGLGVSRMSLPDMLGTMFTADRNRAGPIGFIVHLVNGWLFALVYALIFERWHHTTWWLGASVGLAHGLAVLLVLMPLMPGLHPRMASERTGPQPTRALEPPGFLGLNYGRGTPIVTLLAHVIYGAVIGGFYRLAAG